MSRRSAIHDPGFGSDSFLDVLANIVGILIILFVIAGSQVGRAPLISVDTPPAVEAPVEDEEVPLETEAPAEPPRLTAVQANPVPARRPRPAPPPLDPNQPPPDIADQLRQMEGLDAQMRSQLATAEAELARLQAEHDTARAALDEAESGASKETADLKQSRAQLSRLEEALGNRKETLVGLLAEFEEAKNARPAATQVKHRLSPISQEIGGTEVHFRLAGGRVSPIPIDALTERVKFNVDRTKEWIARHGKNQAIVGPIDGFSMQYVAERKSMPPLQEQRLGFGAFLIGISKWELIPDPSHVGETAEEALRKGSRFSVALRTAPDDAALTFWVYPDSFALFRRLQAACHAEGFIVCGRPLPEGIPISGSPNGSRSAGQ